MSLLEIILIIVTSITLICFCVIFTLVFRHHYLSGIQEAKEGKYDIELIDECIKEDKKSKKKRYKVGKIIANTLSYLLLFILGSSFIFTLIGKISNDVVPIGQSGLIAISTGSMSNKNEKNSYLFTNELNNQIQQFDLIGVSKVHSKDDLKLYDIIVFKSDKGDNIIHRIIEINEYGYLTQGDANASTDKGTLYKNYLSFDRIEGKYNNFKIPFIGMFVIFLQSPSGMITIASIIYCLFMFDHYKTKYSNSLIERSEMLMNLIDIKKEGDGITSTFKETLIYKGMEYHFENGQFVSKNEVTSTEIEADELLKVTISDDKEIKTKKNVEHQ